MDITVCEEARDICSDLCVDLTSSYCIQGVCVGEVNMKSEL